MVGSEGERQGTPRAFRSGGYSYRSRMISAAGGGAENWAADVAVASMDVAPEDFSFVPVAAPPPLARVSRHAPASRPSSAPAPFGRLRFRDHARGPHPLLKSGARGTVASSGRQIITRQLDAGDELRAVAAAVPSGDFDPLEHLVAACRAFEWRKGHWHTGIIFSTHRWGLEPTPGVRHRHRSWSVGPDPYAGIRMCALQGSEIRRCPVDVRQLRLRIDSCTGCQSARIDRARRGLRGGRRVRSGCPQRLQALGLTITPSSPPDRLIACLSGLMCRGGGNGCGTTCRTRARNRLH
jgi:hypothetical protein